MVKQVAVIGGVFLAALAMILLIPTEKCTEVEFFEASIRHCDKLSLVEEQSLKSLSLVGPSGNQKSIDVPQLEGTWLAGKPSEVPALKFEFADGKVAVSSMKGDTIAEATYSIAGNTITFTDKSQESGTIHAKNDDAFSVDFGDSKVLYFVRS